MKSDIDNSTATKPPKSRFSKEALILSVVVHLGVLILIGNAILISGVVPRSAMTSEVIGEEPSTEPTTEEMPEETEPASSAMPEMPAQEAGSAATDVIVTESVSPAQNFLSTPNINASALGVGLGQGTTGTATGGGSGTGTGNGSGKPRVPTIFGTPDKPDNGVVGTFYDLKQTSDRKETGSTIDNYVDVVRNFSKKFDTSLLSGYYKTSEPLYLEQIRIPVINADEAPKAFNVEKEVRPSQWIIHYTGIVSPQDSGTFRFVGYADDILIVAINKKIVLDGSKDRVIDSYEPNDAWIKLRRGDKVTIDIIVGEKPGGGFGAWLAIQDQKNEKDLPRLVQFAVTKMPDMKDMTNITMKMGDKPFVFK